VKLPITTDDLNLIEDRAVKSSMLALRKDLARAVNGRIDFGSPQGQSAKAPGNIDGTWPGTLAGGYMITTPGANVEFTVTHNLGRIPVGYDIKSRDKACSVYDSRKNLWTTTQMFLKCDVTTVQIVLFVH